MLLALLAAPVMALGQDYPEVCQPGSDNGVAMTLRVDDRGNVHLLRVSAVSGDLTYTKVDYLGGLSSEVVERRVSRLGAAQLRQTDLTLRDGVAHACYRDPSDDVVKFAIRGPDGWSAQRVAALGGSGDGCALYWVQDTPHVVYRAAAGLFVASLDPEGEWRSELIDGENGVGGSLAAVVMFGGDVVVAHRRDPEGELRVTRSSDAGRWVTEVVELPFAAAEQIRMVPFAGGRLTIIHGVRGDAASDAGMVVTHGTPGAFESVVIGDEYIGGSIGAARLVGQQLGVLTREMRRSAVFGDFDGLRLYEGLPAFLDFEFLARHDSGEPRQAYSFVDLQADPFGFPVAAYMAERAPTPGDRGRAPVCIRRASDRDRDRLPDRVEEWLGSDLDNPDTDGDGVSDGDAALSGRHPVTGLALPEGILLGPPDGPAFEPPRARDAGVSTASDGGTDAGHGDASSLADDGGGSARCGCSREGPRPHGRWPRTGGYWTPSRCGNPADA